MKLRRTLALSLVTVLGMSSLVGCQSSEKVNASSDVASEGEAKPSKGKVKTLDVVWFSDNKEAEILRELSDKYEAENPDIKIELIEVPYKELDNKIKNMVAAGQPPAIARLSNIGTFKNQLIDLYEYAEDAEAFKANFTDFLQYEFDGKMVAAPMDVTANGLIYNKTAFEKAGVAVPTTEEDIWTWEEWQAAMEEVMAKGDVKYGLVYDKSPQRFTTLLFQAGGSMLNPEHTASAFNSPENLRAVNFFKELHDEKIIPDSIWLGSENPNNLFRTGQVAMHFGGSWLVSNYKNEITDFEWGVAYLPKDKQRSSIPGGKYVAAFDGSGLEKEATQFIEWLSKPENNAYYCEQNYFVSPVQGNESLNYEYGQEYFDIFAKELAATSSVPGAEWGYQEFTTKVQNDIKDGVAEVIAGNITSEAYLENTDKLINEALAELNK